MKVYALLRYDSDDRPSIVGLYAIKRDAEQEAEALNDDEMLSAIGPRFCQFAKFAVQEINVIGEL